MRPFTSSRARTGLASALGLASFALSLVGSVPGARAATIEPAAAPAAEPTVDVDTSEVPDFKASLAERLSIEAAKQAEEYGFEPSQITITIVWLDAASSTYGIHVYIETKDAKLADGPRGPLLNRCERCSQKGVVEAGVEALLRGFEVYEHALKESREPSKRDEAQQLVDREQSRRALEEVETAIAAQERLESRKHRTSAAVLLTVGGVAHVLGITFLAIWKVKSPPGSDKKYLELYVPGMVLLSLSPAPIAAGSVFLARHLERSKKRRASASLIHLQRGLGVGATVRF